MPFKIPICQPWRSRERSVRGGVTILEVGTLVVIAFFGVPLLADTATLAGAFSLPADTLAWSAVFSAAVIAFFAFIGFEDIVNMAEETVNPTHVLPGAIIATLVITVALYAVIASIAIGIPDRQALTSSNAPLASLFEAVTGLSGKPVSAMASIAMVNGILVQIVMASRVIYGMTRENLAPGALGVLHRRRRTPVRAILLVTACIAMLALWFPLVNLAQTTSLVTLCVFILVNISLWRIGCGVGADRQLYKWRYWGLLGAGVCAALLAFELVRLAKLI